MKLLLNCLVSIFASLSAILWVCSARATVLARDQTGGVGGMLGGDLITRGAKGERIDLHATLVEQSRWNQRAAYCAAICAVAQALLYWLYPN